MRPHEPADALLQLQRTFGVVKVHGVLLSFANRVIPFGFLGCVNARLALRDDRFAVSSG
jgi:hypothetical protein